MVGARPTENGERARPAFGQLSVLGFSVLMGCLSPGTASAQETALTLDAVPSQPIAGSFTLAAAGDLIYLWPMLATIERQSPEMLKILRDADVTFGNFEMSTIDLDSFRGSPQAESGGTWLIAPPAVSRDLAGMGFDIVSRANNHATDWGVEGLIETDAAIEDAGMVGAGTGGSLSAARAAHYFDGPLGRVGLVAATTSFTPMSRASDPLGEVPGRAGVNAIRSERVRTVSAADFLSIARIAGVDPAKPVSLDGVTYRAGEPSKALGYRLDARDEEANLRAVRQAKQNGNFAVFSLHSHEPGNWSERPADFTPAFAHKVIDAGADVFIGHGPHQLRGIEIYKGRPIFYSLGSFAMMNNSLDVVPADMYEQYRIIPGQATTPELLQSRNDQSFSNPELYESVIAVSRFSQGVISEIRLYPIDLGVAVRGAARGVPKIAGHAEAVRILERLQRLSLPFGTRIAIDGNVGVIRVAPDVR